MRVRHYGLRLELSVSRCRLKPTAIPRSRPGYSMREAHDAMYFHDKMANVECNGAQRKSPNAPLDYRF